jgi:hypothetical protein
VESKDTGNSMIPVPLWTRTWQSDARQLRCEFPVHGTGGNAVTDAKCVTAWLTGFLPIPMTARDLIFSSIRRSLGVSGKEATRRKTVADRLAQHPAGIVPARARPGRNR